MSGSDIMVQDYQAVENEVGIWETCVIEIVFMSEDETETMFG